MEVEIRISGGDDIAEFAALQEWLRGERALAGAIRPVRGMSGENELGAAYDLLAVALGSGGAGVTLAKSLATWLRTRRPDIKITVTSPSGTITLDASGVKSSDFMSLLQEILGNSDET